MQELMSRHKAYALSPRDCLKTTLFQKWQRIVAPPGKRGRRTVALHEKHQPVKPNYLIVGPNRQHEIGFWYPRNNALSVVVDFLYRFATILGSTGFSLSSVNPSNFVQNLSIRCTFLLVVLHRLLHQSNLTQTFEWFYEVTQALLWLWISIFFWFYRLRQLISISRLFSDCLTVRKTWLLASAYRPSLSYACACTAFPISDRKSVV